MSIYLCTQSNQEVTHNLCETHVHVTNQGSADRVQESYGPGEDGSSPQIIRGN